MTVPADRHDAALYHEAARLMEPVPDLIAAGQDVRARLEAVNALFAAVEKAPPRAEAVTDEVAGVLRRLTGLTAEAERRARARRDELRAQMDAVGRGRRLLRAYGRGLGG